jgi:hypothetical protein
MAPRAVPGASSARRRRRLGGGSTAGPAWRWTTAGAHRPEWSVPGRTPRRRERPRRDGTARRGARPLAALARHDFARSRRYPGPARKAGPRSWRGRGRGRSGGRRRPFLNGGLPRRHWTELKDRFRGRPRRRRRPARSGSFDDGCCDGGGFDHRRRWLGCRRRRFGGSSHGARADRPQSCHRRGRGGCRRRLRGRRLCSRGFCRRSRSARRARLGPGGWLFGTLEQNGAHQIGDLVGHDAQLVFRLEDAPQAIVEERREFF